METYYLFVCCSRGFGASRYNADGGLHDQGEFASNEEAIAHFKRPEVGGLLQSTYDAVQYTIIRGGIPYSKPGEEIAQWKWENPGPNSGFRYSSRMKITDDVF